MEELMEKNDAGLDEKVLWQNVHIGENENFEGIKYKDNFLYCVKGAEENDRFGLMNEYAVKKLLTWIAGDEKRRFNFRKAVIVSRKVSCLRSWRDALREPGKIEDAKIFSALFGDEWVGHTDGDLGTWNETKKRKRDWDESDDGSEYESDDGSGLISKKSKLDV
jgi:hypothetical protein